MRSYETMPYLTPTAVAAELAEVPLFQGVAPDSLARLAERTTTRRVDAGSSLFFHENDPAHFRYVVRSGRLHVVLSGGDVQEIGLREFSVLDRAIAAGRAGTEEALTTGTGVLPEAVHG